MSHDIYTDGRLRERRDDTTRTVTTYDETGAVLTTRPYTPDENTAADQAAADDAARAEREAARVAVRAIVTDLKAEKGRAQAVIDDSAATKNEKNLGRAAKRIADAAIDLAKFVRD